MREGGGLLIVACVMVQGFMEVVDIGGDVIWANTSMLLGGVGCCVETAEGRKEKVGV